MKRIFSIIMFIITEFCIAQCDSSFTYQGTLPNNVTILIGDSCLYDGDLEVLDSIIIKNNLNYDSPLAIGTQTWFNGRLRFLVAGNYGNNSGVNDTIYALPENFGALSELRSLYLEWNRISVLPPSFSDLSNLLSLYINNNILENLMDDIGNLTNLYFLDLGYNAISELPESICELENLSYFWLFNNQLDSLPECFCDMNLDWNSNDVGGFPFFAIGANNLCEDIDSCIVESNNFELSLDQFYYSFPVYSPQNCDSILTVMDEKISPNEFTISRPYPNPFNPKVTLDLDVPFDKKFNINVYDASGKEIDQLAENKIYAAGKHIINWRGNKHPSGMYFIKFNDGYKMKIIKTILVK
ncbi:MAG: hypothetical protein CMG60_04580 [Candidatus Marinimicrobia bacterium]|nr:hypothetical protein [Candidatus Neomarinimicrobiota bacterium]|tara:strand:+ start:1817 stop:2881 length:1065 start_codon:yes stop_codon:yes gene_type:complete